LNTKKIKEDTVVVYENYYTPYTFNSHYPHAINEQKTFLSGSGILSKEYRGRIFIH